MSRSVNATHYEELPPFPKGKKLRDAIVHAVIETPKNSTHKFALENDLGIISLHSTLPEGMVWPYDYGFIPQTLGDDGDPLDVVLITDTPTFSGCLVAARVLGVVRLKKNGVENDRLLIVPKPTQGTVQTSDRWTSAEDLPREKRDAICAFLRDYSQQEGNVVEIAAVEGVEAALESIEVGFKKFKKKKR